MSAAVMEWRQCPGFPDYDVSDCGDVRRGAHVANQPNRRLRGYIDVDGYLRFSMKRDGESFSPGAHQLVAEAFVGPRPTANHQVAHENGSRLLNTPANLRWSLCIDNQRDRKRHGTKLLGGTNPKAKITDDDVRFIRRRYREIKQQGGRVAELDLKFGMSRGQIIRIARKQSWGHVK